MSITTVLERSVTCDLPHPSPSVTKACGLVFIQYRRMGAAPGFARTDRWWEVGALPGRHSAIDSQDLSGHVAGGVGREKEHHPFLLVRLPQSTHRVGGGERRLGTVNQRLGHPGGKESRSDGIDRHAA